jgi:L-2-hydroxyglutarate oxidase
MTHIADVAVLGGGIVGLNVCRELRRRYGPSLQIVLLEKEARVCQHGSGRNSGVLHAGFYYSADSLKARFCREGNAALTAFCDSRRLKLARCGKLVVARDETELTGLDELMRRATVNGVELYKITEREAAAIEPRAITHRYALWSPTTKAADVDEVAAAMLADVTCHAATRVLTDAPFHAASPWASGRGA